MKAVQSSCAYSPGPLKTYLMLGAISLTAFLQSSTLTKVRMRMTSLRTNMTTLMKMVKLQSPLSLLSQPPQVTAQQMIHTRSTSSETAIKYHMRVFCFTQAFSHSSRMNANSGRLQSGRSKYVNSDSTTTVRNNLLMCSIIKYYLNTPHLPHYHFSRLTPSKGGIIIGIDQKAMRKKPQQDKPKTQDLLPCPDCTKQIPASQIRSHMAECSKYVPTYLNNVTRFIDMMTPEYMQFLDAEMDLIKETLQAKIAEVQQKKEVNNLPNSVEQEVRVADKRQKNERVEKPMKVEAPPVKAIVAMEIEKAPKDKPVKREQPVQFDQTLVLWEQGEEQQPPRNNQSEQKINCIYPNCKDPVSIDDFQKFRYLDQCLHCICLECLKDYISSNYIRCNGDLKCPNKDCGEKIPTIQVKETLDPAVLQKLEKELNSSAMNIVECQKCHEQYEFIKGKPADAPRKTSEGKEVSPSSAKHYAEYRFQCPKCRQEQCKQCKVAPYHLSFTCEQFQEHKLKKKCRYCRSILPKGYMNESGMSVFDDICEYKECSLQMKEACSKRLKCGHACFGSIREKQCLPCLKQKCALANSEQLRGENEDSYCSLCYVETLSEAPCVKSSCGHFYHLKCLQKRLQLKWGSPRITFNFSKCPLCNQWLQLPAESSLYKTLVDLKQLYNKIREKSLKRLTHEGNDKDTTLSDKASAYYNNPEKYAMTIYAYFQCFKCNQPYFGGRKSCAEAMVDAASQKYDPKQLVCPSCCPELIGDCKKHGKEYVSYKCKFCCGIAQWFCWGNTHFCDNCHKRQIAGQYISRIPKDKLPKCEGKGKCPSGGQHGGNGEQFCLGCGVCRGDREGARQF